MDAEFGERPAQVGKYRLLQRLATGGFGEVFYAEHTSSGVAAAVKLMHRGLLEAPKAAEYRRRFRGEVEFLSQLEHPAVPKLLAAEPDAYRPWLATAFVAGPTLAELVDAHGPLPSGAVRALALRIAEVLDLLHRGGRAHRDLTPKNVLVTTDGAHVIDFGLARVVGAQPMTQVGHVMGTVSYLPPERPGQGTRYDAAGDVFGLGGITLFAATGHPPFDDLPDVLRGRINFRGVPSDLSAVLRRLLDQDPEVRGSAAEAKMLLRPADGRWQLPDFADALAPVHREALRRHPVRPAMWGNGHDMPAEYGSDDASSVSTGLDILRAVAPPEGSVAQDIPTQDMLADPLGVTGPRPADPLGVIGAGPFARDFTRPPRRWAPRAEPVPRDRGHHTHQTNDRDRRTGPPPGERFVRPVRATPVEALWDRRLGDWVRHVVSTPDGTVLAATADGVLTAMDGRTGHFRWDERLPGGLHGAPVVDGGLVHAGSADGWLNTLDTLDTAERRLTGRRRVGGRVVGCAVAPGRVVVAVGSGVVWSFPSAQGAADWSEPVGAPITTPPVVAGRIVYVADARGLLHALHLDDGAAVWPHPPDLRERPTALAVADGLLVAAGADGGVHAFDTVDGAPRWKAHNAAQAWACLAVPGTRTVHTGALDGAVRGYDTATGELRHDTRLSAGIHNSLAQLDELLVVGCADGSTVVLDPVDGQSVWRHNGAGSVHAPAAVVPGGPVVIGGLDGRVCGLPPP
ncbi:protein kinase domain-containing protein [Yinghuangia sp. YIM S10712]|uniref:serine/threonine-protein kinase n=1 Tax=Yinghuangia sp. YIM S10712 TaxID=3436930 RepID=UPI003F52BEB5